VGTLPASFQRALSKGWQIGHDFTEYRHCVVDAVNLIIDAELSIGRLKLCHVLPTASRAQPILRCMSLRDTGLRSCLVRLPSRTLPPHHFEVCTGKARGISEIMPVPVVSGRILPAAISHAALAVLCGSGVSASARQGSVSGMLSVVAVCTCPDRPLDRGTLPPDNCCGRGREEICRPPNAEGMHRGQVHW
jgi:hypothetical protein